MPPLQARVTHDIVIHVNNSVSVGLTVLERTYRRKQAPTFAPRMTTGDPRGMDRMRWKSWVQSRFDGGAGQIFNHSPYGNARFAESSLIDIGIPLQALGAPLEKVPAFVIGDFGAPPDDSPIGDFAPAILPQATTAEAPGQAQLFTNAFPVHIFEHSFRPHMIHYKSAFAYTATVNTIDPWPLGAAAGEEAMLTGVWAVQRTNFPSPILHAIKFSGVIMAAMDRTMMIYGPILFSTVIGGTSINYLRPTSSTWYVPAYSTLSHRLEVYDGRLWRMEGGRASYLRPVSGTWDASWSDPMDIGDPSEMINNTCLAFGKLYFGKRGSLQVWDAGRIYEIDNYEDERDPNNFKLMIYYRGAMYYNIRQQIYRVTSAGSIEKMNHPVFEGVVTGGCVLAGELHTLIKTPSGEGKVWIFNAETGGTRQWFSTGEIATTDIPGRGLAPVGIISAYGLGWIAPMFATIGFHTFGVPVVAVNKVNPARRLRLPKFAKSGAYLIMSMTDQGLPNLDKLYNRVVTDYFSYVPSDQIEVYWLDQLRSTRVLSVKSQITGSGFVTDTGICTDGIATGPTPNFPLNLDGVTGSVLAICFASPVTEIRFSGQGYIAYGGEDVMYYVGTEGPAYWWQGTVGEIVNWGLTDGTGRFTRSGVITIPKAIADRWQPTEVDGVTGYWFLASILQSGGVVTGGRIQAWEITTGPEALIYQPWNYLGTIADPTTSQMALSLPTNTVSKGLMLMFKLKGSDVTRPEVTQVEIEYLEADSAGEIVTAQVFGADGIVPINRPDIVENSGAFITASLFSMSHAKTLHVVQLPWPVLHTIRARVEVLEPGVGVPFLGYDNTFGNAVIPIMIEEL